ncbi:16S rRNA (adenine(1518)-N(6)/adenine(1519)-N(6))-dimethyltransferase RsmA [Sinanaerobacter chloroacetimidivorans]|jgi:16S rRNA (adenine1518-N6/adenine1519-N6)-dimethyltransferase|uniref:Ribosomal RNA small subunit methyltransferase A n=1 Tax=Sinanaerobacter chloroacetimidivorans TaxID=2818044 RepID=A0A8J7W2Q7_9FIRM|nr:16S rRNA (adenine(1518)-N(6)/adenine(1519)-N(6))-dimethyltransferase RsmA [Sinanaerobacter chloroacetimidivorans]MBR0598318.1 16S rRNA (adenine(1518)-N(6)/adenine(1519)-N(6))-dimethyltransferase RsmA [Sinanaerobacter chloroacetimidivorans]
MDKLYAPTTIRDIKNRYGFKLSKSLGQNFLTDKNIIDKIIEQSFISKKDLVIEIGPGIGVLTAAAAEAAGKVVSIEIDHNLIPILKETLHEYDNITIVNQDIMKTNLHEIMEQNHEINGQKIEGVKIIGNLPYYITTPIIMKILEDGVKADSITIMLQKEVADRIKAQPGTKAYGALSVAVQYYCTVSHVASAPKEIFIPQPKVDSTVIRLDIRKEKPVLLHNEEAFFAVIKAGFGQRRKTLLNSLTGVYGLSKEEILAILNTTGIDPSRRAETLRIEEFAELANTIFPST